MFSWPKLYPRPLQISAILNENKNVHIPYFSWPVVQKVTAALSLADQLTWNFATMCWKGIKKNSEILETLGERVLKFWLQSGQKSPPPLPIGNRVKCLKVIQICCLLRRKNQDDHVKASQMIALKVSLPRDVCFLVSLDIFLITDLTWTLHWVCTSVLWMIWHKKYFESIKAWWKGKFGTSFLDLTSILLGCLP